eukprot:264088_1
MVRTFCFLVIVLICDALDEENTILKVSKENEAIIECTPSISHNYISNTSPTKIGVLFDITTSQTISNDEVVDKQTIRQPFELAIVLDRSGSMAGDKIRQAKLAMIGIIDNMIEGDIIHIIQYDHAVQLLIENGDKQSQSKIIRTIDMINPGGATNLFGGLSTAYDVLKKSINNRKNKENDVISHSRIFLFSDGLLNAGVTDTKEILDSISKWKNELDVTISSFGIGYDYDRKLMNSISEATRGEFFFIDSAEAISKVIEIARKDAASLVGNKAVLTMTTAQNNTENINVKFSNMFDRGLWDEKQYINYNQIDIRDLRAGDSKYVIIELLIEPNDKYKNAETINVMQWKLEYNDILSKQQKSINGNIEIELIDNEDKRLQSDDNINHHVDVFWKLNQIRIIDKEILTDIENERFDEAINKRKLLFNNIGSLRESQHFKTFAGEPSLSPSYAPSMSPTSNPTSFYKANMRMVERMEDDVVENKIKKIKEKRAKKKKISAQEKEDVLHDYGSRYAYSSAPSSSHYEL